MSGKKDNRCDVEADAEELQKLTISNNNSNSGHNDYDDGGGGGCGIGDGDRDVIDCNENDGVIKDNKNYFYENIKESELNNINNKLNKDCDKIINDNQLNNDINSYIRDMELTDDTSCGFWIFKGSFLQRFANKKAYVILYGIVGCVFSMTYAYFNGTITTLEKRFKIPSRNTGIITVGNDISQVFVSAVLSYYAGKGHRPRWIGFGLLTIVAFCMLNALPHYIYGPGDNALMLTKEYGAKDDNNISSDLSELQKQTLCKINGKMSKCENGEGNIEPQLILFLAQFISGIGGSLYYTLGVSYMDDNIKKSKTPALLSLSYFMRMLGPAVGYALSSFCLRMYISPNLTPIINDKDPRWLGAWWVGWLLLGTLLLISGVFLAMFPRQLPRAAARKIMEQQQKRKEKNSDENDKIKHDSELPASFKDMIKVFKNLLSNSTFMCNNLASIFYFFGYMPYWIFTPKYIEIQYRQSASTSSLVTGTVALGFSAIGVLLSGFVISKYKPRARYMAAWNVACGLFSVIGMISYAFLGCPGNENSMVVNIHDNTNLTPTCNSACQCDYVQYSPVCGADGNQYISPCHAGCKKKIVGPGGKKFYYDCGCIGPSLNLTQNEPIFERLTSLINTTNDELILTTQKSNILSTTTNLPPILKTFSSSINDNSILGGHAVGGPCPVDCFKQFVAFLGVMCFLKFIGATGRASNFLVSVRCVAEKDKTVSMGFGLMLMSILAFIPSPIFFGWVLDSLCLVWGKTCTTKGNCWLYNAETLRYKLNFIASVFVAIGTLLDIGVWYFVKDLKIFDDDDETKQTELKEINQKDEITVEKKIEI